MILSVASLVGCSMTPSPQASSTTPGTPVSLDTAALPPGTACAGLSLANVSLAFDQGARVIYLGPKSPSAYQAVFPIGFTATWDGNLRVFDRTGREIASEGAAFDHVGICRLEGQKALVTSLDGVELPWRN